MEGHKFSVSLWKDNSKDIQRVDFRKIVLLKKKELV